jgi:hypothetical protein
MATVKFMAIFVLLSTVIIAASGKDLNGIHHLTILRQAFMIALFHTSPFCIAVFWVLIQ